MEDKIVTLKRFFFGADRSSRQLNPALHSIPANIPRCLNVMEDYGKVKSSKKLLHNQA